MKLLIELVQHCLDLALPPLYLDSLKRRVEFLLAVALVHRSFTKWAQDKLHEQFVFTFRGQVGEQERLQERLTSGFGSPPSETLSRLYLNLRAWDAELNWTSDRITDVLKSIDGPRAASPDQQVASAEDDFFDIEWTPSAIPWNPYEILRPWLSALTSVWLLISRQINWDGPQPYFSDNWSEIPRSRRSRVVSMASRRLAGGLAHKFDYAGPPPVYVEDNLPALPNLQRLVLIHSTVWLEAATVASCLPRLDILESISSDPSFHPKHLPLIRPIVREARFYATTCPHAAEEAYFASLADETPMSLPQRLKECSFTWLNAPPLSATTAHALEILQGAVAAAISDNSVAVHCRHSEATEEGTIERILAELVV